MIKFICDICKSEIENNSDGSKYVFFEYKMEKGGMVPRQMEEIYCSKCTQGIKDKINKLKAKDFSIK